MSASARVWYWVSGSGSSDSDLGGWGGLAASYGCNKPQVALLLRFLSTGSDCSCSWEILTTQPQAFQLFRLNGASSIMLNISSDLWPQMEWSKSTKAVNMSTCCLKYISIVDFCDQASRVLTDIEQAILPILHSIPRLCQNLLWTGFCSSQVSWRGLDTSETSSVWYWVQVLEGWCPVPAHHRW